MGLSRRDAKQGHAIPKTSYRAHGPFSPEILTQSTVYHDSYNRSDLVHEALDDVRMFRCKECGEFLYEVHLSSHVCGEEDDEYEYYEDEYEGDDSPIYGYDPDEYGYDE